MTSGNFDEVKLEEVEWTMLTRSTLSPGRWEKAAVCSIPCYLGRLRSSTEPQLAMPSSHCLLSRRGSVASGIQYTKGHQTGLKETIFQSSFD